MDHRGEMDRRAHQKLCLPFFPQKACMERIERLAELNPATKQVSGHSLEMFRLLRAYAMLDWVLRHPNDLGSKQSELKFEKLIERTWWLMDTIQGELEGQKAPEPKLIQVANG